VLAVQAVELDGKLRGTASPTQVPAGAEPRRVDVVANGFVVELVYRDSDPAERWGTVTVDPAGQIVELFTRQATPPSSPMSPTGIAFHVVNAAEPIPSRPNGSIIEPVGKAMLVRERANTAVGQPTALQWRGNWIAHSMNVSFDVAWTGRVFLYPFWADELGDYYIDALLPVDCQPDDRGRR
jgi:hypothetical protein